LECLLSEVGGTATKAKNRRNGVEKPVEDNGGQGELFGEEKIRRVCALASSAGQPAGVLSPALATLFK